MPTAYSPPRQGPAPAWDVLPSAFSFPVFSEALLQCPLQKAPQTLQQPDTALSGLPSDSAGVPNPAQTKTYPLDGQIRLPFWTINLILTQFCIPGH